MQQAIPYKSWPLPRASRTSYRASPSVGGHNNSLVLNKGGSKDYILNIVSENAVIVFARKGCCMSHVVRRLLLALGVNPAVCEIDEAEEVDVLNELGMIAEDKLVQLPAVFIGGRLFGGLDKLMATHISGELIPLLKDAGALWL